MPVDARERDTVAEEQARLARCHRGVRAERGQHGDLAAGGRQAFVQEARDLSGARVQPSVVGRNEQDPPRTSGDHFARRDLVDEPTQLVERDGMCGVAHAAERFGHQLAHEVGSEK